mmetsp:Transcript_17821/g.18570  ORF Transcript_17821/g.18570 Transcript_17821/m.18570 type:complete len:405 (-) Transcript_17821:40-1254(-)
MIKKIAYNVLQYLQGIKEKYSEISPDNNSSIDLTCQYLENIFQFNLNSTDNFKELSYYPLTIDELVTAGVEKLNTEPYGTRLEKISTNSKFQVFVDTVAKRGYFEGAEPDSIEYLKRHSKVLAKFQTKMETKNVNQQKEDETSKVNREQLAEEKKTAGNAAIAKKNFEEAIALYSESIALSPNGPNSHIYYSNRAAAYCHLNNYQQAANDCEKSIALNYSYVKAHSRLGLARFFLGQYKESIAAYENAVTLEPSNKSHSDALKQAKQKLDEQQRQSVATQQSNQSTTPGGMPDLSALAGLMGGGAGGAGGGLASLLQNPQMMQMAQQMMQNPQLMQQAMAMMGGGGGNGMPDMSALASMFGGGGGGGSGIGPNNPFNNTSTSTGNGSGGGGGLPSFSGFVDENR